MSDYLQPSQQTKTLSPTEQQALDLCLILKQHSDVFCPVMQDLLPLTNNQFAHLVLQTLLEIGYEIKPKQ